jgi:uncharacterized phage protein gp47/JayE
MSLLPVSLDMTDRDFDSLQQRLVALVRSVFPDWTDFAVASFGNVLLEMYAFVGDVLGFYIDSQARESRLSTATQRKNVIALARMLGYKLHGARAATAEVVFSLSRPASAAVRIASGSVIRTREVTQPVKFQLLADVVLPEGAISASGIVEHSKTYTQAFDTRGLANLDILLDHTPFLDGSAVVSAANGLYLEQDSLLGSGPNDRHFLVLVDQNERAALRFGNGASGSPPSGTLTVTYKTGGGSSGNVDADRLVVLEGAFIDAHGRAVSLSVTNPWAATGGGERQSIASARLLAPESLRTSSRSVTREDFEINARRVPGVARALMLTSNEDNTMEENSGVLYVIPKGGGMPTPALKNQVLRQVTEVFPSTLTFQVSVASPVYKKVDVEARVYLRQGHSPAAVRERVKANLAAMFRESEPDGAPNPLVDFGFNVKDADGLPAGEVAWSDVFNVIRDTEGVRKIGDLQGDLQLNGLPADVKLGTREFPVLGQITLYDGATGGVL